MLGGCRGGAGRQGRLTLAGRGRQRGSGRTGPTPPRSRGAGRTGPVVPTGSQARRARGGPATGRRADAAKRDDDLGGTQVEGRQAVRELLVAGRRKVYEVWVAADLDPSDVVGDIVAIARANRVPVVEVSRAKLEARARSEAPQGVLALAAPLPAVELDSLLRRRPGRAPFLVALDGVTDPGNLGALLRVCDGAGVDGVVLPRHRAVHVTPTVAKASVGAVEHVPIAVVGGLPAALARIRDAGVWVVGLHDAADRSLFELGDLAEQGICMVLGAEGTGLSRLARERCDLLVRIPMRGRLSSLNVSTAAALACYEVARHR